MDNKVVLIGLDGVDFGLIEPWINRGGLPNIETILSDGAKAKLKTCPPSWTIPNWNVITTGKTPGTLGVYDFMSHERATRTSQPYFVKRGGGTPLWRYIEQGGGKSCIANLPNLHAPSEMEGVSLVGWLPSNDNTRTYPPSLQAEIDELVDGYKLDVKSVNIEEGQVSSDWDSEDEFLAELFSLTEDRIKVFDYLFELDDWDFFMPVFTGTDRINHALWEEEDHLQKYYARIDEWIGSLLEQIDDGTVIGLVSDHGFAGHDRTLYLNEWFERNGFLAKKGGEGKMGTRFISRLINNGRHHLPTSLKAVIPDALRDALTSVAETSFKDANIDWENTTAYCTSVSGTIYIDDHSESESEMVEQIAESLKRALCDQGLETGEFRIYRTSEVYESTEADAPELIVEFDHVDINTSFREGQDDWLIRRPIHGNHQRTGLLAFYGDGIENGEFGTASVTDVAPTVLYQLEAPIPTDLDGDILFNFVNNERSEESIEELSVKPIEVSAEMSTTDEDEVEERLESLGYL